MAKTSYSKAPLTIADSLALYTSRSLTISDPAKATHYLKYIGYYRLSAYAYFFTDPADPKRERFLAGTTFQNIWDLYVFDRKLRLLLWDALDRIEIAVKASLSNSLSTSADAKGAGYWFLEPSNFDFGRHNDIINMLNSKFKRQDGFIHQFIPNFFLKYTNRFPPSWMVMEALSFGNVSTIYELLRGVLRIPIAIEFALNSKQLESWLHSLTHVRNCCAHHARAWNITFPFTPIVPKKYRATWPASSTDKLYVRCCMIHHLMKVISDGSKWNERLRELINNRPSGSLSDMGFPSNWESEPFWDF